MKISTRESLIASAVLLLPQLVWAQGLVPVPPFAGTSGSPLIVAVRNIINIGLSLAAFVAAIMILYGGVRYIISRGEESEAEKAKDIILYAVIGLVVIGISAAIVNYVIGAIGQS